MLAASPTSMPDSIPFPSWLSWVRRTYSLACVFVLTKLLLFLIRWMDGDSEGLWSLWTPFVFLLQDAWMVGLWGLGDGLGTYLIHRIHRIRRTKIGIDTGTEKVVMLWEYSMWVGYGVVVIYTAANIPITRVFSSPLTLTMWAAAGGAISDSIWLNLTPSNVLSMCVIGVGAWIFPRRWIQSWSVRGYVCFLAVWGMIVVIGTIGLHKVETLGVHRNAWVALVQSVLVRWQPWERHLQPQVTTPLPTEGKATSLLHLAGKAAGRHVVWINLESTGARYLKPYGATQDPMPQLTRFAQNSLLFTSAYATYPESIKGFYSMICSATPAAHTDASLYAISRLPCSSVAQRLKRVGYRTGLFHSGRFYYLGMEHIVRHRGFDVLRDADTIPSPYRSSFGVDEAATIRAIRAWLDSIQANERLFLMYLPITGHHPYESPGKAARPFGNQTYFTRYLSDLHMGDVALGTLFQEFSRRGWMEQTLWIFVGDHGEAFFQHKGNFAHTLFVYEENVHVPLLIVAPGLIRGVVRVPQITRVIDIAPTLFHLLGLPVSSSVEGRSMLSSQPGVARFYADQVLWQIGIRHGSWKFIYEVESKRTKLFHLPTDPMERRNVAELHKSRVLRYRTHALEWAAQRRKAVLTPSR